MISKKAQPFYYSLNFQLLYASFLRFHLLLLLICSFWVLSSSLFIVNYLYPIHQLKREYMSLRQWKGSGKHYCTQCHSYWWEIQILNPAQSDLKHITISLSCFLLALVGSLKCADGKGMREQWVLPPAGECQRKVSEHSREVTFELGPGTVCLNDKRKGWFK